MKEVAHPPDKKRDMPVREGRLYVGRFAESI